MWQSRDWQRWQSLDGCQKQDYLEDWSKLVSTKRRELVWFSLCFAFVRLQPAQTVSFSCSKPSVSLGLRISIDFASLSCMYWIASPRQMSWLIWRSVQSSRECLVTIHLILELIEQKSCYSCNATKMSWSRYCLMSCSTWCSFFFFFQESFFLNVAVCVEIFVLLVDPFDICLFGANMRQIGWNELSRKGLRLFRCP